MHAAIPHFQKRTTNQNRYFKTTSEQALRYPIARRVQIHLLPAPHRDISQPGSTRGFEADRDIGVGLFAAAQAFEEI